MLTTTQITFRNTAPSKSVESAIREWVEKLGRRYDDILKCRVTVSSPSFRKRHGGLFHTRVDIRAPGRYIVANRQPDVHHSYVDVYISVRDAFENAQRQLDDNSKFRQSPFKRHFKEWTLSFSPRNSRGNNEESFSY